MNTMENAIALGNHIYNQYKAEGGGCENLLMEWAKERLYGRIVQDHLPYFDQLHALLIEKGHVSYKTCSEHGDMDYSLWAEQVKNPDDLKVIVSICHCVGRDDNTLIFTKSGFKWDTPIYDPVEESIRKTMRSLMKFRVFRAWPRQKKSRYGRFGDHRDIAQASLATHRRDCFQHGYRDGRDEGHVLSYEVSHRGPVVDKAHWSELEIPRALDELQWLLCDLRGDHN